ncbi:hypothetical protein ACFSNO_17375 [Streptomyces cirratus]
MGGGAWPRRSLDGQDGAGRKRRTAAGDRRAGPAGQILAGYWIVDVDSEERALEIAARASACPGPGGKPGSDPVEVHRIPEDPAQA